VLQCVAGSLWLVVTLMSDKVVDIYHLCCSLLQCVLQCCTLLQCVAGPLVLSRILISSSFSHSVDLGLLPPAHGAVGNLIVFISIAQ